MPRRLTKRNCLICGAEFESRTTRQTCSRECQNKLPKDYECVCVICGKSFYSHKPNAKGCSPECRKNYSSKQVYVLHQNNLKWKKMHLKSVRNWQKNNLDKKRIYAKKSKHQRRSMNTKLPSADIVSKRINHFDGCCYCDRIEDLTLEHLIPIAKGGTNLEGNLYGACKACNSSKQDKPWRTWYRKQRFYKPEREMEIRRMSLTLIICKQEEA